MKRGIVGWLWRRRDWARTAFIFRLLTMALGTVLSLYWIRALTGYLGAELYGLFMSFMAVTRLWTLGEAGLGSAVALHAIPLIAQHRDEELVRFLATARTLFVALSAFFASIVFLSSPWLPTWLRFQPLPGAGSLTVLFVLGAAGIASGIAGSYVTNLNYALGNVAWPVLPAFVVLQLSMAAQVLLAKAGSPLWIQYLPHLIGVFTGLWIGWLAVKWGNPALSAITPLSIDKAIFKRLLSSGFWIYLSSLGNLVFTTTSQLIINAGFGPEVVPRYVFNYKIPELTYAIVSTAGLVAFSRIARLVNSSTEDERNTGNHLFTYLHRLQIWAGMCVAVVYVFLNDKFIELWLGPDYRVSVYLQLAFAANLVFAAAGDAALRGISMFSNKNLAYFGRAIFGLGVLNLGLSLLAMKFGALVGIAVATLVAQFAVNYFLAKRLRRDHAWVSAEFLLRTLVHPLIFVILLSALKLFWPTETPLELLVVSVAVVGLLALEFRFLNLSVRQLAEEYKRLLILLRDLMPGRGHPP